MASCASRYINKLYYIIITTQPKSQEATNAECVCFRSYMYMRRDATITVGNAMAGFGYIVLKPRPCPFTTPVCAVTTPLCLAMQITAVHMNQILLTAGKHKKLD